MISSKSNDFIKRYFCLTKIKGSVRYFLYFRNFVKKYKYSEKGFGAFFALQLLPNVSTKFSTFSLFILLLIKFIFIDKFSIIGLIFGSKVSFCTNFIVFFFGFEILVSGVVERLENVLAFSLTLSRMGIFRAAHG